MTKTNPLLFFVVIAVSALVGGAASTLVAAQSGRPVQPVQSIPASSTPKGPNDQAWEYRLLTVPNSRGRSRDISYVAMLEESLNQLGDQGFEVQSFQPSYFSDDHSDLYGYRLGTPGEHPLQFVVLLRRPKK